MSLISELMSKPGVIAAGEYSFRGDRYSYEGQLEDEMARMASIMCRATSLAVRMESSMLGSLNPGNGLADARGWAVRGPKFSVCVVANTFCFLDSASGSLSDTLKLMLDELKDAHYEMI
ncbi:MAG: DUF2173 family protein [Gammaproteobacteria bacterium]|jgi:roadblock/LC7 domain-containing protein